MGGEVAVEGLSQGRTIEAYRCYDAVLVSSQPSNSGGWLKKEQSILHTDSLCACLLVQSCPTLCNPMDCSLSGSSVHGIFQARILEYVAIPFSKRSSQPRDRSWVSMSPALQADSLLLTHWESPHRKHYILKSQVQILLVSHLCLHSIS